MTENTLDHDLLNDADRLRGMAKRDPVVMPGSGEQKVWVKPEELDGIADRIERKVSRMTAFEREHPGYAKALRNAAKSHERHVQAASRVGKSVTLEHMRRVHEALKLNHMARFAGYAVDENGSLYRVGVVRRAGEAPSEIMFLTMTRDDLDDIADLIAGFDNEYPVRAFLQFVQERFNIKLDRPKLLTERD